VQSLTFLVDVELRCHAALRARLRDEVARFAKALPPGPGDLWDAEAVRQLVAGLKVDTFGHVGSRLFWDCLGVLPASEDFVARAQRQIAEQLADPEIAELTAGVQRDTGRKHQRVFAYAEYDLEPPPGESEICGRMLFENGYRSMRGDQRWLKHTPLPLNTFVDRRLCAEHQMMTEFCTQLKRENLAGSSELNDLLCGRLYVYTSLPPCISCVLTLWQFKMLFAQVELQFSSGSQREAPVANTGHILDT